MRSKIKLMQQVSVGVLLTTMIAPAMCGQQSSSRASIDRMLVMRNREFNNKMLEKELRGPAKPEEIRLALAQIKEDFVRMQVANNDMAEAVSRGGLLDLKFIARGASEIRKRAGRLKYNLALPKPAEEPKVSRANAATEAGELKSSLSTLDASVIAFVNNPMFKAVNVVDTQSSVKARHDLEQIILLSEQVKKNSEKLDKAQKAQ